MGTTAIQSHIFDLSECSPGSTILHVSLRDLSPEVILFCDNVIAVFSPFGLGVLDIAVGKFVCNLGIEQGLGMSADSFLLFCLAREPANKPGTTTAEGRGGKL